MRVSSCLCCIFSIFSSSSLSFLYCLCLSTFFSIAACSSANCIFSRSACVAAPEFPFLNVKSFCPDKFLQDRALDAATLFIDQQLGDPVDAETLTELKVIEPKALCGTIASGDKFFADRDELVRLKEKLPEISCVEMECAAVAQVCYEYDVPCLVIRTISDLATKDADVDCLTFMRKVSHLYSENIIKNLYESLHKAS